MIKSVDFPTFFSKMTEIKVGLDYYTNFDKVISNVAGIRMKLNQLNYLVGEPNIREAVENLWKENKSCFEVLGILIAVRKKHRKKAWGRDGKEHLVYSYFDNVEQIIEFIEDTGLIKLFQGGHVKNLVDYVFGVETGLDSHARKNRIGEIMASKVAQKFDDAGIIYKTEIKSQEYPLLTKVLGKDIKKFDFVISTSDKEYLLEVNYYGANGSKVTEIPRSYMNMADKINTLNGYEFVWITDGQGWNGGKDQLQEAYEEISELYNLNTLDIFIEKIKGKFAVNKNDELPLSFE